MWRYGLRFRRFSGSALPAPCSSTAVERLGPTIPALQWWHGGTTLEIWREEREQEEETKTRERRGDDWQQWQVGPLPCGVHVNKTSHQNHWMVKMNGFKSWMVKDFWFCGSMVKNKWGKSWMVTMDFSTPLICLEKHGWLDRWWKDRLHGIGITLRRVQPELGREKSRKLTPHTWRCYPIWLGPWLALWGPSHNQPLMRGLAHHRLVHSYRPREPTSDFF